MTASRCDPILSSFTEFRNSIHSFEKPGVIVLPSALV